MDAAGQYAQTGTIRPAQSLFAAATGAVAGPVGANVGFMGNVLLGGAAGVANTIFMPVSARAGSRCFLIGSSPSQLALPRLAATGRAPAVLYRPHRAQSSAQRKALRR